MRILVSLLALFSVVVFFMSCQKQPEASFTASKTNVVTGEVITFNNNSKDASSYKWSFGDGKTSTDKNPTHSYENPGTYTVELTAYSKNEKKSDKATATITVTKANEIKYDGNKYPLTKAYSINYGNWDGEQPYYNFDIILCDDGITLTPTTAYGTGNFIYLEMWSQTSSSLMPGTYTFSGSYAAFTFSEASLGLNYDVVNETGQLYEASGGTVTVSISGSTYIFDVTLTLPNGKTVNAYYKGTVIPYTPPTKTVKILAYKQ